MEKKLGPTKGMYSAGPQQQFIASAMSMGWQMAVVFLVPVICGIELDKHFKTSPLYTLIGFGLAIILASLVVWRSVRSLNDLTNTIPEASQADQAEKKK